MKEKVYMVCDYSDKQAESISGSPNIGVEFMGDCGGRILKEDGSEIGKHHSSTFGWLRYDLKRKLVNSDNYEIIDLIGQSVPEKFKLKEKNNEFYLSNIIKHYKCYSL